MNCEQLRDHLLAGGPPNAAEARAHAAGCESCAPLLDAPEMLVALRGESKSADLEQLRSLVREDLLADNGTIASLRSLPTLQRSALVLALGGVIVAIESTLLVRADMHLLSLTDLLPSLVSLGVLAVIGIWVTLRPLHQRALSSVKLWALVLASLALPLVLTFLHPTTGHPAASFGSDGDFSRYAASCFGHGLALCALVWLAFKVVDRNELGGTSRVTAGTTAALVAVFSLVLHCPIASATHWLLAHAGISVLALLGGLVALGSFRKS